MRKSLDNHTLKGRPNKTSKGMTLTNHNHTRQVMLKPNDENPRYIHQIDVARLIVRGTCDLIGRGWWMCTTTKLLDKCPCCGSMAGEKVRLTEAGRRRLAMKMKAKGIV